MGLRLEGKAKNFAMLKPPPHSHTHFTATIQPTLFCALPPHATRRRYLSPFRQHSPHYNPPVHPMYHSIFASPISILPRPHPYTPDYFNPTPLSIQPQPSVFALYTKSVVENFY